MKNENIDEDYTKEPWEVYGHMIFNSEGRVLGKLDSLIVKEGEGIDPIRHANARRVVACINACVGIPTEKLERVAENV